jgi:hypothetical protein
MNPFVSSVLAMFSGSALANKLTGIDVQSVITSITTSIDTSISNVKTFVSGLFSKHEDNQKMIIKLLKENNNLQMKNCKLQDLLLKEIKKHKKS